MLETSAYNATNSVYCIEYFYWTFNKNKPQLFFELHHFLKIIIINFLIQFNFFNILITSNYIKISLQMNNKFYWEFE